MKLIRTSAGTALLMSLVLATNPANAQIRDLDPAGVAAATRYALPSAFEGFMRRCFDQLDSDGYAISNADRLRVKFSEGVDDSWPGAKVLLLDLAKEEAGDAAGAFELLGDDNLRIFVDGLIENIVEQEIETDECEMIERGLEIFDPMPANNVGAMIGFLVEAVPTSKDSSSDPEITDHRERKFREQQENYDK